MKIKEGFVLREIADSIVVVPTGALANEFKGMIHLNATAKFIWELLKEDRTVEQVADKLMEEYGVELERAMKTAQDFTQKLKDASLLEE